MSLAQIIADAANHNVKQGICDREAAIAEALPQVLADPLIVDSIVRSDLSKRLKQHLVKVRDAAIRDFDDGQGQLFGLRPAHVLAGAEGIIKSTAAMSRIEFAGLIKMREQQITDDLAYLARLKFAQDETALIWDKHPGWSWGQVQSAYARMKKAA